MDVVPNIPHMRTFNPALGTPSESHAIEKLVDIKLQRLRHIEVAAVEIHVVGEVVKCRYESMARVGKPLRREVADQVVVPEYIRIRLGSADVELGRVARKGNRFVELIHSPSRPGTARSTAGAIAVVRRLLSIAVPASRAVDVVEGFTGRGTHRDGDRFGSRATAFIPFFHRRIVGSSTQIQAGVERRTIHHVSQLVWSGVNAHGSDAQRAAGSRGCDKMCGGADCSVISWRGDVHAGLARRRDVNCYRRSG